MTEPTERIAGDLGSARHNSAATLIPTSARPLQGKSAGLVSRAIANGIDVGVVVGVLVAGYLGWAGLLFLWNSHSFSFPTPSFGLVVLIGEVLLTGYFAVAWMTIGRTYGDYLLGLRVLTLQDRRLRLGRSLLRAILCTVFPLGLLWVAASRDNRSIQDLVTGTTAVYDWAGIAR